MLSWTPHFVVEKWRSGWAGANLGPDTPHFVVEKCHSGGAGANLGPDTVCPD